MAPFAKIYTYPNNFRMHRAQVLGHINGLEIAYADGFQMGVTNRSPEYLAKFPMGKVPVLEGADGFCVAEGGAICSYIAASGPEAARLLGGDVKTQTRITEWGYFAETELVSPLIPAAIMTILKGRPYDAAQHGALAAAFERAVKRVDAAVASGAKFLVGDQLTLADVMVFGPLHMASAFLLDAEMRKGVPNLMRYLGELAARPEISKFFGEMKLVETRARSH